MKRSPLPKRTSYLARGKPPKRSGLRKRSAGDRAGISSQERYQRAVEASKRRRPSKVKRFAARRDPIYHAWVGQQKCVIAGKWCWPGRPDRFVTRHQCVGAIEVHHINGRKVDDLGSLVSLCHLAHIEQYHRWGRKTFAERYQVDLAALAAQLYQQWLTENGA